MEGEATWMRKDEQAPLSLLKILTYMSMNNITVVVLSHYGSA